MLSSNHKFPIPEGVTEVTDDYQLNLAHYELQHLKPRGTILFSGEPKEIPFQFFCGEKREDGIYAKFEGTATPNVRRILDYLEKYPRVESFITVTLLQFKLIFVSPKVSFVHGSSHVTLKFDFPAKILKTHRRKFIRIPFNDSFPAFLTFTVGSEVYTRKLRDLSREGMRIHLEPGDAKTIQPGVRLKHATLKVLNRDMPVGVSVVAVHGAQSAGARIIAISEEDKTWIKECIRILMKQILNLKDLQFDDQIERDKT